MHLHSTASDGTDTPAVLAQLVYDAGLKGFALTDHDTTSGIHEARQAAEALGLLFIPGIELSTSPASVLPSPPGAPDTEPPPRGTLHILGYGIDETNPVLLDTQSKLQAARDERNPAVIEKLNELGVRIEYEQVLELAQAQGATTVGRPHIAQVLLNKGYVKSIHDAFQRYLGFGGAAHIRRDQLSAADAINAILQAGGVAVLAHPVQLRQPPEVVEHVLTRLKDLGLGGLEVNHHDHTPKDVDYFLQLTDKLNLCPTAGSDYHGSRKNNRLGAPSADLDWAHALLDTTPSI